MMDCPKCGDKNGKHFVPPSLGELGFYTCECRVIPESGGHIESADCWCGPTVEEHLCGTLIIHNQTH